MKIEAWIFGVCSIFLLVVTPAYWLIAGDWTGTSALTMTFLLTTLITFYLGFHAGRMEPRPEDRKDGEIADGAGELGFFPPYSWWPLWCAHVPGRDRPRRRDRLVAVHHRAHARCGRALRPDLRVLPGRTRALSEESRLARPRLTRWPRGPQQGISVAKR